jgi:hypothetical protein
VRLTGSARRVLLLAAVCTAATYSLGASAAVADAPPSNSVLPAISGNAVQGSVLTASTGTWSGDDPITFSYVWSDGQTGTTATLSATDVGQSVTVTVTAVNAFGQASATSATVGPVLPPAPVKGTAPVISGTAQQGNMLSVSAGTWSNNPTGFTYIWEDCDGSGNNCTPIAGATSSSYTLQASDVGSTIVASVTASNAGGPGSAASGAVGPVLPAAPAKGIAPVISGTPQQGSTLSVSNGTWSNDPTSFSYAWQDCDSSGNNCTAIAGATSSSYTLQASDVGRYPSATVTAVNAGGQLSATSAVVGPVLPLPPVDIVAPGITGTAQQGHALTANHGVWTNSPTGYSYTWQDCNSSGASCSAISGATSSSYTLHASDVGKYVSVIVTASNAGGSGTLTSASMGPVLPPAPVSSQAPAITGTAQQGKTLSVSNGTWNNAPTAYSYAWEDCNSSGANCVAIRGATSNSYVLSAADVGSTIVCVVSATGPGGTTSASSNRTAVVVASPIPVASQPTTSGLLVTPSAAVTNEKVTLIATVTAGTSSTALWGSVTFASGGAAIAGCTNTPVIPSGLSATVACSTSFAASTPHLSATFVPSAGSILAGSVSPAQILTVGPDASSTSLSGPGSMKVDAPTTYTVTVTPPAARPGPQEPTGSVQFLDGGQAISSCSSQPLVNGGAACTVAYQTVGAHSITARYSGDANFSGSSSSTQSVSAVAAATNVVGAITSTMQWAFKYTPSYTLIRNLVVNGASPGVTVVVKCHGSGCPFVNRATVLANGKRCAKNSRKPCFSSGSFNITPAFAGDRLAVGTWVTVSIIRPNWVGKSYRFTVRARRGPRIQIGCLAPGATTVSVGC